MHSLSITVIIMALNSVSSFVDCNQTTIKLIYNLETSLNYRLGITQISLFNGTIKLLENSNHTAIEHNYISDTDFNSEQNFIVWSDRKSIYKTSVTENLTLDTKSISLLDTTFVNALAYDWVYNLLYFVNADEIQMINITDTRMRYIVVRNISPDYCKIRVNPINSTIVWVNTTNISKSSYDGSNIELLAEQDSPITALTIDIALNTIYFVSLTQLIAMDFRGDNKRVYLQAISLFDTQSVDIYGELVFWTKNQSIYVHDKNFNQSRGHTHVVVINDNIKYIKIMHSTRQPHTINHCLNNNCTHICVAHHSNSYHRCVCPSKRYSRGDVCDEEKNIFEDIKVIFSANKNIWLTNLANFDSNQRNKSINQYTFDDRLIEIDYIDEQNLLFWSKSNPNRTEEQLIVAAIDKTVNNSLTLTDTKVMLVKRNISKIGQLLLFAIDWIHELIYYMIDKSLIVAHIKLFRLKYNMTVNSDDTKFIMSLAVNPIDSLLFWSEINKNTYVGVIVKASQDGSNRKVLSHEEIITPLYLTVDYHSKRLFYYDYLKAVIASFDFNGQVHRIQFRVKVKSVSAIEILGRHIYFNNYGQFWKIDIYDKSKVSFVNEFAHPIDTKLKIIDQSRKPINAINRCVDAECEHLCLPINVSHYKCVCAVFDDENGEREFQDLCTERIGNVNRTESENIAALSLRLNNFTVILIVIIVMALLSLTVIALFLIYFFVVKKRLKLDENKSREITINDGIKDCDREIYDEVDNHDNHYESPYYNNGEENKYEATNYYDLEMEHKYDDSKQVPTYTQIFTE